MRERAHKLLNLFALLVCTWLVTDCGGTVNQGDPGGTLVATGSLSGVGSVSASSTVSVYSQGSGAYAVQLASLSYSGSSCSLGTSVGVVAGSYNSGSVLQGTSGTYNYYFYGLSTTPTMVFLYCTGSSPISSGITAETSTLTPT